MTTKRNLWVPRDIQIRGAEHLKDYLKDPVLGTVSDILTAFYDESCVLSEEWPMTYGAQRMTVDSTATRRGICEDASGDRKILGPIAGAGALWWELLSGGEGFADVWFEDDPLKTYYVGLRRGTFPVRARQLSEPTVSGYTAPFDYDVWQEAIGTSGVPDAVDVGTPGQITFQIDTLTGSTWTGVGNTRKVIIWKNVPETGSSEAIAVVDCAPDAGPTGIFATVPHEFGQTAPSATAGDYTVLVLGPTITEVNISADQEYVFLGTVLA